MWYMISEAVQNNANEHRVSVKQVKLIEAVILYP